MCRLLSWHYDTVSLIVSLFTFPKHEALPVGGNVRKIGYGAGNSLWKFLVSISLGKS